jgi:Ribosomal protein L30/L7E
MTASKTNQAKLTKSGTGRTKKHKLCTQGQGIKKRKQVATVEDTPSNRGMINKNSDKVEVRGKED